jgi:hypothetical protein
MNKIFYFLMVFFAFSAVQVGAFDGKGQAGAAGGMDTGFKVDGAANLMGKAICPEGGCDSARGTKKARDMKGDLDSAGFVPPAGVAPNLDPHMVPMGGAPGTAPMGDPSCAPLANGTLPPHCK